MSTQPISLLIIDNHDSFTYNLYQCVGELSGQAPQVVRNDACTWEELAARQVDGIIISPGPGRPERPEDVGISLEVLAKARVPILGVCLGHQAIGHFYGAQISLAPMPMHGRVSRIHHAGGRLFENIPSGFDAVRYHSLLIQAALPTTLRARAWTQDGLIMAVEAVDRPLWGVQFHPESIASEYGQTLLQNFVSLCREHAQHTKGPAASKAGLSVSHPDSAKPSRHTTTYRVCTRRLAGAVDTEDTFLALYADSPSAFWLDSNRSMPGYSRFSFFGDATGPAAEVVTYRMREHCVRVQQTDGRSCEYPGSIFDYLKTRLANPVAGCATPFDFVGGYVGYFGYELKAECGAHSGHDADTPDAMLIFADRLIAVDPQDNSTWLVHLLRADTPESVANQWFDAMQERLAQLPARVPLKFGQSDEPVVFTLRHGQASYLELIAQCREAIRQGESYEICLTNSLTTPLRPDPLELYRSLRRLNPAPYAAYLRCGELAVLSSSPERFLKIDPQGRMQAKPIKGTAARSADPVIDQQRRAALLSSEKERAENLMIVDLLRNDLGRVARLGTVQVAQLMEVETYATLHQLVSTVVGQLAPDKSPVDAIQAAFPGGSMSGAPKRRSLEILDTLEAGARGVYSGALGFLSVNGALDLSIVIRSLVLDNTGLSLGVGGAITWLSDPLAEFEEMLLKAQAPMRATALLLTGDASRFQVLSPTSTDRPRSSIIR